MFLKNFVILPFKIELPMSTIHSIILGATCTTMLTLNACNSVPDAINSDAQALCNCYKQVHKISVDEEPLLNFITDSCNTLWKGMYDKYASQDEDKKLFNQAYSACQDE
jgi:hypothetical protein